MGRGEDLAVGRSGLHRARRDPARADDELPDAVGVVPSRPRVLRREALVVMVVAIQHDLGARSIEDVPERLDGRDVAVLAGCEARMMPVGEDVVARVIREVRPEPPALG